MRPTASSEGGRAMHAGSTHAQLAGQFVQLVTGPEGQRVLADAGFARP